MDLNGMEFEKAASIQEEARKQMLALSPEDQKQYYAMAERKYRAMGWDVFSPEGKDTCALLEYIEALP